MTKQLRLAHLILLFAVPASALDSVCLDPPPVTDGMAVTDQTICYCSSIYMTYDGEVEGYPLGVQPMTCELIVGDTVVSTHIVEPGTKVCVPDLYFYHSQPVFMTCENDDGGEVASDAVSRTFRGLGKPGVPVQIQ